MEREREREKERERKKQNYSIYNRHCALFNAFTTNFICLSLTRLFVLARTCFTAVGTATAAIATAVAAAAPAVRSYIDFHFSFSQRRHENGRYLRSARRRYYCLRVITIQKGYTMKIIRTN
uniref:Uncharacterized protein n=1 Tax=Sipha flava TaxID=143950 RepID=A0A2S2QBN9_9HEMI